MLRSKWWGLLIVIAIAGFLVNGCGPRACSSETKGALDECNEALRAAQAKLSELETQLTALKAEMATQDADLNMIRMKRDSLRNWLDILEAGY
jgi:septal ring factor EnvC (AmiA/AmiB activator)